LIKKVARLSLKSWLKLWSLVI